ncbi:sensor histidine kinase [Nocardioides panacisoli]|uniref:sensor histidine kinase n=1 Tax=Nocardioides panacisoli TaxID=627624 RepID=UPI001C6375CA|nr:sensor histidine kinase [Nocardioides panacisoli]QYJ05336.1 sensor histidine kinase [Nocardioides panacisoli]
MTREQLTDGTLISSHPDCSSCTTRECLDDGTTPIGEASTCRYGLTYARIDDSRLINGVVAVDLPSNTKRSKKRARTERSRHVRKHDLEESAQRARRLGPGVIDDYELMQTALLHDLESKPAVYDAIARKLREDFADNLNQSHDFLQLVKLVRGHAEQLLHAQHPKLAPEEAANKLPTEGAIFYSTELMLVKMDSMLFLNEANRAAGGERRFQIHPFALKYLRIYRWQAEQKHLQIDLLGTCYAYSYYNNDAIGAVIQGLLDNLVKYAPANSQAAVILEETEEHVALTFESLGPKIEPSERIKIFLPQYRAEAARRVELSGLGVGLATARQISDVLNLDLRVDQAETEDDTFPARYLTRFTLRLNRIG